MSDDKDPQRISDAADNCEVLRARLAKYQDAEGRPVVVVPEQAKEALDWIEDFIARCNGDDRGSCDSVNVLRTALESQAREIERLKSWKSEEMEVMTPLLDYARSVCTGPLGCSITEWLVSDHKRLAALKAQPSGVVLPEPDIRTGRGYPAYSVALVTKLFARLNSSPVSAGDDRETIRAVFLRNGFTIKEGQADLKPYVYAAADELMSIARAALSAPSHGEQVRHMVPAGWNVERGCSPSGYVLHSPGGSMIRVCDSGMGGIETAFAMFLKAMLAAAPSAGSQKEQE